LKATHQFLPPQHLDAGIEYLLLKFAEDGHVCYPLAEFVTSAADILESPGPDIDARILVLESELRLEKMNLIVEGEITPFLWSKKLFSNIWYTKSPHHVTLNCKLQILIYISPMSHSD